MENVDNRPQSLREVQIETRFYDDRRKRADYVFRTDGIDRFVCEAKSPLDSLKPKGAYQAQRYAYNLGVRIATLTNFAKLQIFILGGKPDPNAPWDVWKEWSFTDYIGKASEIWELLSRERVQKNGLEQTIAALPKRAVARAGRQGWLIVRERVQPVDSDFLDYVEAKRVQLAGHLLRDNREQDWNEYDLNEAAQRILNQILFIRISEDRDIDTGHLLEKIVRDWTHAPGSRTPLYPRIVQHFRSLDKTFNGSLFKPHFSDDLVVSDEFLIELIEDLSSEDSPYLFSTLPIEILGSVYERFLGKTLRIKGRRVELEIKPELRKAGGIYYTPRYVVDYIVRGAIQPLIARRAPRELKGLRIVDIACGSGSFLISAFEQICNHHVQWYRDNPQQQDKKNCYKDEQGELRLTTHAKQEVLLNNIFGVDLDTQAVELSIFSLYLKLLEGETKHTLLSQHLIPGLEKEKYLPPLEENIQTGNSLIGEDYYSRNLAFDEDNDRVRYEIKPFDWRKHFSKVYRRGGFDVVVGNPPYRRELNHKELMAEIAECEFGQMHSVARMDLWYYFVHRGLEMLKSGGILSFITNSYWVASTGSRKLIEALKTQTAVEEIFHLEKLKIFDGVSGQHMMFRLRKDGEISKTLIRRASGESDSAENYIRGIANVVEYWKSRDQLFRGASVDLELSSDGVLEKLNIHPPLVTLGEVRQGIAENPAAINKKTNDFYGDKWTVGQGVFSLTDKEVDALDLGEEEQALVVPYHEPRDLGRYFAAQRPSRNLIYSTVDTWPHANDYPKLHAYLRQFSVIMKKRRETASGSNKWWHLHWPRKQSMWESPKIICLQMMDRPSFVYEADRCYVPFSINVFCPSQMTRENPIYITALLNSKVLWKWFYHHAKRRGVALEINGGVLSRVPIRRINFADTGDIAVHDQLVSHASQLHALATRLRQKNSAQTERGLQAQFDVLDSTVDSIVGKLYGLDATDMAAVNEIATVPA